MPDGLDTRIGPPTSGPPTSVFQLLRTTEITTTTRGSSAAAAAVNFTTDLILSSLNAPPHANQTSF